MKKENTPHEIYMQRCLDLAIKGLGNTYPNPLVGSVIVYNNIIIGEGWHHKAGEAHAEVNAIASVKNKALLKESILYVNLEPCNHTGKTPPCSHLIVSHQFKKVVVGCVDPFDQVNGNGIRTLEKAGIEVVVGVLEKEAQELNKRFFTVQQKKRPYVILKWAESADGFIAPLTSKRMKKEPVFLSSKADQVLVHQLRTQEDSILVGAQTVIDDNPRLTSRWVKGRNPVRIILDPNNRIDKSANIFDEEAKSLHITKAKLGLKKNNSPEEFLRKTLDFLYQKGISSILVEG
ncbi:bifunctional diaminohydroxyphosphoribosylaminopyrimidine deaminase/5-amino-6-(5-phosphoribosylamino)uracil reductase RibD, partial [Flavobacteriaceae bacterium]|nr:bifunctional diaminohydroxyphosphoribosylaminopyrimidine deaminase/5-amino-6-(5-phosphoribosylamino)uracil reductase RibD [Flavobacteriaceae bacterium]